MASKPDFSKPAAPAAKTRRQKVAERVARAAQDDPNEAANAAALLANMQPSTDEEKLEALATDIMSIANRTIEDEFAIGRALTEAAAILDPMARKRDANGKQSGSEFTDWFNAQGFPFSMKTAKRLRIGVEREAEVRALIADKVGRDMGVNTAVAQLLAGPRPVNPEVEPTTDTTPVDPAYDALRKAHQLIVEGGAFATMHVDDLAKSAAFIKGLAGAYNAAKAERGA